MFEYIERNRKILEELRGLELICGELIGQSDNQGEVNTRVLQAGEFHSNVMGRKYHIAVKRGELCQPTLISGEIAIVQLIWNHLPELRGELPAFFLYSQALQGVVTEDFTEGGKNDIWQTRPHEVPRGLAETLLRKPDDKELPTVGFMIQREDGALVRRLGDFNTVRFYLLQGGNALADEFLEIMGKLYKNQAWYVF